MRIGMVLIATALVSSAGAFPAGPKGTEWESEQELGYGKLAPRAWFGHFPDARSARKILMQESPWHRFLDSETEWRFRWSRSPESRPAGFYRVDYDVSKWDVVKVPCSWQAIGIRKSGKRFGMPIFLNQGYIWNPTQKIPAPENLWPRVTGFEDQPGWTFGGDDNPVGSYRRDFEVPAEWNGKEIYLQFDGVESFFYLWVNGRYVGYSKNSRNAAVFNVTKFVRSGSNTVAVEVYRNCDGSYLEAQDVFRLSGIHRPVRLYCAPKQSIADAKITVRPAVKGVYEGDWRVKVTAEFSNVESVTNELDHLKGYTVAARVFDGDGRETAIDGAVSGSTRHRNNTFAADDNFSLVTLDFGVKRPKLWSAEKPDLYTLVLELEDESGTTLEAVGFQLGFRQVEIRRSENPMDDVFLFNGKPIKVKGVNLGECCPVYGHYVSDALMLEDITLIKRANMNHIRCSHFPKGEYFYYLCNKYGIYVMDEANLESHGYAYGTRSLSHREEWLAAHWDRVRAMYEWSKNNPSVIMWSMGNEAGPGRVFKECYENLKGRDPDGRPINWERNNLVADIGSRQYPPVSWVQDVAAGTNTVRYPYHINEYAHDRLSSPNTLDDYQKAIESSDRIIGAAIWDWADQAIYAFDENGKKFLAYGGDFGEKPVERSGGDGILEGVVSAERKPEPSYLEAKYAFQPYVFSLDGDALGIRSRHFFVDSSDVGFEWRLFIDGRPAGEWEKLELGTPLAPRELRRIALPAAALAAGKKGGADLRLRAVQKAEKNLLPAGWTVAEEQLTLSAPRVSAVPGVALQGLKALDAGDTLEIGPWRFSRKSGCLLDCGMTLDALRYPVGDERHSFIGVGPNAIYRECLREGLRETEPLEVSFSEVRREGGDFVFETSQLWRGKKREDVTDICLGKPKLIELGPVAATNTAWLTRNVWRVFADGTLELKTSFELRGRPLTGPKRFEWAWEHDWGVMPRLGWRFEWPVTGAVGYYGCGPWETYPRRKAGAFPAVWRSAGVAGMGFLYPRNQDFGSRVGVRWVEIEDAGIKVSSGDRPFEMAVSPWSPLELMLYPHPKDLPEPSRTILSVNVPREGVPTLTLRFRRK